MNVEQHMDALIHTNPMYHFSSLNTSSFATAVYHENMRGSVGPKYTRKYVRENEQRCKLYVNPMSL